MAGTGNSSSGQRTAPDFPTARGRMAAYDRLPRELREVLARAPHRYCIKDVEKNYAGWLPAEARRLMIAAIVTDIGRRALEDYGPEHPQAAGWTPPAPSSGRG